MKKKKIITGGLIALIVVPLLSVVVKAQTVWYNVQMPDYGDTITENGAIKADEEDAAYNSVYTLGWVENGDSFLFWIVNRNNEQLTYSRAFTTEGLYKTGYLGNNAHYYCGSYVQMRMKTDLVTTHPCDATGKYTP